MTQLHAPTSAIVIRHGESEWNVLGKWQGRADTQLTPAGRAQARAAAERLLVDGVSVDRVAASSLTRARETAEIIATHLGVGEVLVDDRLVETDVGPWQGLREHEIEARWPNYLRDRRTPQHFEAPDLVFARAEQALRDLMRLTRGAGQTAHRVLVVTHSGVIRTVRRVMQVHDRRLHNLEGCHFTIDAEGNLVAGDFVALVTTSHVTTNDAV
jgi:probable phosphoglycerate mutase